MVAYLLLRIMRFTTAPVGRPMVFSGSASVLAWEGAGGPACQAVRKRRLVTQPVELRLLKAPEQRGAVDQLLNHPRFGRKMQQGQGQLVQVRCIGGCQRGGGEFGKAQLILKQPAALNFCQRLLAIGFSAHAGAQVKLTDALIVPGGVGHKYYY